MELLLQWVPADAPARSGAGLVERGEHVVLARRRAGAGRPARSADVMDGRAQGRRAEPRQRFRQRGDLAEYQQRR
ncbi:hypothetical protein [Frateuria sp.]|uniref:hypothetical protein n=1 Tax=Frateuria sp. TaxID=2211372 RepID=UPI0018116C6C|nr:hypothetical protein [Frateuria sp.]NUR21573.1 hypothetical protein [Frateuria sp.]